MWIAQLAFVDSMTGVVDAQLAFVDSTPGVREHVLAELKKLLLLFSHAQINKVIAILTGVERTPTKTHVRGVQTEAQLPSRLTD